MGRVERVAGVQGSLESRHENPKNRRTQMRATVPHLNPVLPFPQVYADRAYAFCEFRSVEEASNAMALDGVPLRGGRLRVRRPNNYDPLAAAVLAPTEPDPGVDAARLGAVRTRVPDSPAKLFVGGLPCDWDADHVKTLLEPFGRLAAFNLVMDKDTGNSKGYAFCEYADAAAADYCIATLHGAAAGPKALTVKRALEPGPASADGAA